MAELIISIILPSALVLYFYQTTFLYEDFNVIGAQYGDLPFHLNIISSFAYGCNMHRKHLFDILSPFYANEKLAYPIIADYQAAILFVCFNIGYHYSLVIPSSLLIISIFVLLHNIISNFTENRYASMLGPWIFLFMGGRGVFCYFLPRSREDFISDYVHHWGDRKTGYWLHTILHIFLPQRVTVFGLPLSYGFIIILLNQKFKSVKPFIMAGLLVAIMPHIQAHACISAFEFALAFGIINFPWKDKKKAIFQIKCYICMGIPALGIGIPQLIPFFGRVSTNGFTKLKPIWKDDRVGALTYWWDGLFIFWAISIIFGLSVLTKKQFMQYIPALFVYYLSNFIKYQPWNMDNTKVFHGGWTPLAVAVVCNYIIYLMQQDSNFLEITAYLFIIACVASGIAGFAHFSPQICYQWNYDDFPYEFAEEVIAKTDPTKVWAADTFHNHPVSNLAGRQVLVGYGGWMISHNLDNKERLEVLNLLMKNPDNTTYLDKHNVKYIAYHKTDRDELKHDIEPSPKWKLIIETSTWKAYERTDVI